MEFLTSDILFALITIIIADLLLAGDNALVIGMACRGLPARQKLRAMLWGVGGALALRIIFTSLVALLMSIPLLQAIGGILLAWIAVKLLTQREEININTACDTTSFYSAVKTIILADVVMSLDNVLAVAGAAHGSIPLVVFGLLLSVPIVIFGSQMVSLLVERYPVLLFGGAGVLAWTAGKMLMEDATIQRVISFLGLGNSWLEIFTPLSITIIVMALGWKLRRRIRQSLSSPDV